MAQSIYKDRWWSIREYTDPSDPRTINDERKESMKKFSLKKTAALVLSLLMLVGVVPTAAFAAGTDYASETHDVFKHTESTLAPGVEQYINYAYAKDGKQMVYYVATADITRDDVVVQTSYLKQHENGIMGMEKLTNQMAYANGKYSNPDDAQFISEYYNVVAGVNASFYNMTTGQPMGITYIDGVSFGTNSYDNFFAILKDGKTAVIDYASNLSKYVDENGQSTIWQAVAGSVWLVRDGKDVTANASGSYNTDRHSRTCVGITADGKVVTMVLDGRQEPFSCGGTMHELAQIMLEAGCVAAVNLDGGGSATYAARPEGADAVSVINRPSDGSERSISAGLIIASTAAPSNVFDRVSMTAADEYVTPGTGTEITVSGVSPAGTSAEIPEGVTYAVSNGTYENGILTPMAVGDTVLTARYEGRDVGSVTVHGVMPEKLAFVNASMTVPFGKTVTLNLTATYGLNEVKIKAQDVSFTLGNPGVGTIDGFDFTAGDGSVTESAITAAVIGTDVTAAAQIKLGKGSQVIFDFENGTTDGFDTGYAEYNYYLPKGGTFVATPENGKVRSGSYSLGINIDYSNSQESGYQMTALYRSPSGDSNVTYYPGVQSIGAWVYIPDEYVGLWIRWVLFPITEINEDGTYTVAEKSITSNAMDGGAGGTGVVYSFSESGWHYISCDLSKYKGLAWYDGYYAMQFYISDRDGASYNYYAKEHPNINGNFTVYLDDITLDYSTAVDDREAPVFSGATYATPTMSDASVLNDGASIADNTVDFAAAVADDTRKTNATGIDGSTACAYIDGNPVPCTFSNGTITIDNSVTLTAGQHTVKFSVCDKQGNYASLIRNTTITGGEASQIRVIAHDASLDRILFGSLYYVDVVADDVANVQSVTTTLNLDSMNKWELDHMVVAKGFEVTYDYQQADKILTLTITRTGETDLQGQQALVSIPVRVWELDNVGSRIGGTDKVLEEGNKYTYSWFKNNNEYWWVAVEVRVQQGLVTLADGRTETFTGENVFCDTEAWAIQKFMVETQEGKDYKASWNGGHTHTAQPLPDKAATCTEDGYTGRTYCQVCSSVVEWGTAVPATGHSYELTDGVMKCSVCGELLTGQLDGKRYADGILLQGWDGESYYVDGVALTGLQKIDGYYYDFGEDGVCPGRAKLNGFYYDSSVQAYRYFTAGVMAIGEVDIYPNVYFYDENGCAISGQVNLLGYVCHFDEKGAFVSSDDKNVVDAGFSGTNIQYVLLSDGTLKVDGTGAIKDYTANGIYPAWIIKNDMNQITALEIGSGITKIGRFAFFRNGYLKNIRFAENSSLETIGWGAFGHCWRLTGVTIPASVRTLDPYAFYECGAMKYVDFEAGSKLTTIDFCAFQHGMALESVFIPESVTKMGGDVFIKANPDMVLKVAENSVGHSYALNYGLKYELRAGTPVEVASGSCGENAVWTLYSDGELRISGSGAMTNYTSHAQQPWGSVRHTIKKIVIGKDITSVGSYAFAYCQNTTAVEFEEGSKAATIGVLAFFNNPKVTQVNLPETVTYISAYALGDCFALESVYVPQNTSGIYKTAFTNSAKVVLNVAEGSYGEAFAKQHGIAYTTRPFAYTPVASGSCGENAVWTLYSDGELRISGSGAMTNYTSHAQQPWGSVRHTIKKIVIGKDITSVGSYAFAYCQNTTAVEFEEGSKAATIGVLAFFNNPKVTQVNLPETVTYISAYALGDCFALESVYVPQNTSGIYKTAFTNSAKVVLNVAEGSYGEAFAKQHGIAYTTR